MRGKVMLVSAVIALVAFSGVLLAMTSEEISKLPLEKRMKYEEKMRVSPNALQTIEKKEPREAISFQPDEVLVGESVSKDGTVMPKKTRKVISRVPDKGLKATILAEGFEGTWPPTGWTLIQTSTDQSASIPGYWSQTDYDQHTGTYSAGLWWSYSHQDEWLITSDIELTGSGSGVYYVSFWTYGYKGSIRGDHYYVKVSTDGGTTWDVVYDLSSFAPPDTGWNQWDEPIEINLSVYADSTIKLAWHAEDPPSNDGLWYIWLVDDIEVGYPLDHDVGVTAIYQPVGTYGVGVDVTPSVEVGNFGAGDETFDVTFKIFDSAVNEVYSGTQNVTVNQGATQTVDFAAYTTALGSYTTLAYTELGTDEEPGNDTLAGSFNVSEIILSEGFEAPWVACGTGYDAPPNWTVDGLCNSAQSGYPDLTHYWSQMDATHHPLPNSGDYCAGIWWSDGNGGDNVQIEWLISPELDLSAYPNVILTFWTAYMWGGTNDYYHNYVKVSTDGGETWDVLADLCHDPQYQLGGAGHAGAGWNWNEEPIVLGLGAYCGESSVLVAWNYDAEYTTGQAIWAVDDVQIAPPSAHDVAVDEIIEPTGAYSSGDVVTPRVVVSNLGMSAEDFDVTLEWGDTKYSDTQPVSLEPGEVDTVVFTDWTAVEGTYEAIATADLPGDANPDDNTATSPFMVVGWVEDFETTDGGFAPTPETGAWEWGEPTSGPGSAFSGVNVWATNLEGDYTNSADWRLERDFVATSDDPVLSFYHWYDIESYFDGGNVKISSDGGATWQIIYPEVPYPEDAAYSGNAGIPGEPCYSGSGTSWQIATFDLSAYVNTDDVFLIRWHFGSDASVPFPGWYIDDVMGLGFEPFVPEHDIEVYAIISPPAAGSEGEVIPQVVVVNRGNEMETFPISFEIFEDADSIYYSEMNPTVGAGVWDTISFDPWNAVEGSYTAGAIASCEGDVDPTNDTLYMPFTVFSWVENFDDDDGGFEATPETGAWEWGEPTSGPGSANSGVNLWATNLSGDYVNYADWRLERNFYALSDNPVLSFYHWYVTEDYFDGGNVKISTDGGETWDILGSYLDPYNEDAASSGNEGIPGEPCFSGSYGYWQLVSFDLSSYVDSSDFFRIRWHFGSDVSNVDAGWYVDDVAGAGLTGYMPNDTRVEGICSDPVFEEIEPNHAVHLCAVVANSPIGPVANFRVFLKIANPLGELVYSSYVDVRDLAADASRTVWFPTDWIPSADTYTIVVTIQNAFELPFLLDNNVMQTEVTVGGEKMALEDVPDVFFLSQSSPNPAMGRTAIDYGLPVASKVNLRVYDITGRVVATLVSGERGAGYKTVDWNLTDDSGKRVARGIYFYKLSAGDFKSTKKLVVVE